MCELCGDWGEGYQEDMGAFLVTLEKYHECGVNDPCLFFLRKPIKMIVHRLPSADRYG